MGSSSPTQDIPDLETIWSEDHPNSLKCCECDEPFSEEEALIRTFSVLPQHENTEPTRGNRHDISKSLTVQNYQVLFFDRHLQCIATNQIRFISISHVWDPRISDTQARGRHPVQDITIRQRLFSSVLNIAHGLNLSLSRKEDETEAPEEIEIEIWHDYFSVPQWQSDLKGRILHAIPEIFQRSGYTVVFLDDITPETIHSLYHGESTPERLAAVTRVCNAAWFKRVWTVMEFVRASRIKVMLQGYHVVGGDAGDDAFLPKLVEVWDHEADTHGAAKIEDMVRLGTTIVPWNLGPLQSARSLRKLDFASAWILLSRRGCRSIHDFLHALLGLLRAIPGWRLQLARDDSSKAVVQIATACLRGGDYSPLFMTPTDEPYPRRHEWRVMTRDGFNDVTTFGLGHETSPPTLHQEMETSLQSPSDMDVTCTPMIKMNRIGKVSFVFKSPRHPDPIASFAQTAQLVLTFTGPDDVRRFATTICCRLYHMPPEQLSSILNDESTTIQVKSILQTWYDDDSNQHTPQGGSHSQASKLANLLQLALPSPTNGSGISALTFLQMHGGTVHLGWSGGFIGVTCEVCHETFLYRAALYKPSLSKIRGAVAYRVPGLSYWFASRDGVGLLVADGGLIVGRLIWGTPACDCVPTGGDGMVVVRVEMPDFYSVVEDWRPT